MLEVQKNKFGVLPSGEIIDIYTIKNSSGIQFSVINYGGRFTSIMVPDKLGKAENVVLGYDNLDDYIADEFYLGAIVGRYANRIANGKFRLNNVDYTLKINNGPNHLHGGLVGFDKVVWDVEQINNKQSCGLKLTYISNDGEEGYPGKLNVEVKYLLTENNEIIIDYEAVTDKPTPVNITHHGYFNLSGDFNNNVLSHGLKIISSNILENDINSIPTGKLLSVIDTPFDFTKPQLIGDRIFEQNKQLSIGNGYDHCYVFNNESKELKLVSVLTEANSGRQMEVYTTEPSMQFYSGNFLSKEKTNGKFTKHSGLCLETQHYPNSPNNPEFPSTILMPNKKYKSKTIYKFITE